MEFVVKNLSTKKTPDPNGFTEGFFQTHKEEIVQILHKIFHNIEEEGILPDAFYEASKLNSTIYKQDTT